MLEVMTRVRNAWAKDWGAAEGRVGAREPRKSRVGRGKEGRSVCRSSGSAAAPLTCLFPSPQKKQTLLQP